jgi:predicted Zn-dependent peptidase
MKHSTWILAGLLSAACASTRLPLPAPPPVRDVAQLSNWREPPPIAPEPETRLAWSVTRTQLANGLGVTVVSRPGTRSLAMQLRVPGAHDTSEGPVAVMAEALRAGTRHGKGEPLVNPQLGFVPIDIWTDSVGTTFLWQVLPRAGEQAVGLLADFVRSPAFVASEVEIRLRQELASIQRDSSSLAHVSSVARSSFPGLERPTYAEDARGLFKLKPAILRQVHTCTLRPEGAELVVVGPVEPEQVNGWATAAFGSWKPSAENDAAGCERWRKPATPLEPKASRLDAPLLQIIYAGRLDPWLFVVVPGPDVASDDFLPFALLAQVLDSRDSGSAKELRHMGATYGIHAGIYDRYAGLSLLELQGQVEASNAKAALRSLVEDIRGLASTLQESELDAVKRRWRNDIVNSFSANEAVAQRMHWQLRRGRNPEELPNLPNELMQVDVVRCRQVAERWLQNAQPSLTVAGVPVKLVQGLGLGVKVREMYFTDKPKR